ncbi:hypothetical protein FM755_06265 [Francisella tularensis]|uniref:Uncharacterized protein n=2 Tax=Francisella tularensis subsp. holarctica TaxID=119857 RepID=A0AAI8FU42_FRATH|nr:hypothetical protein [Francisella tularensis]AFX69757.1 hypothetical protein F92_00210 [Francisella tularensis subsp. holarctica F92]EBA51835.1 hypothetical protein FTHG_00071 [Francisella tularensis subsp. holarctica 257]ABI82093.1 conserved hypothetical protein [Francisella tularensis subsp. holarctica OSU18]AJI50395.1 hypothetical protein DA46_702 [Francisella tularensis subsp. holarctica]AJI59751.1 hypothetical protein AW21_856 [Francisella tularensis subsp. holarctica LVS]
MKKLVKIAVAPVLALPVVASAITMDEMLKFSSEHLNNTPISEIKIDPLGITDNFYLGQEWTAEVNGKEYLCSKPGLAGFWIIGKGCQKNPFK